MSLLTTPKPARTLPAAPVRRRSRGIRQPTHWPRLLLALAGIAAAYAGLHVVLQDLTWWFVGSGFALLVLAATTITRLLSTRVWLPYPVAAGAAVLGITAGFAGDTAVLGVLPTFETGDRIGQVLADGWQSIQDQRVPAVADTGILLLLVLTLCGCALSADASIVLARSPALVAVPLLTLLAIPVAVRPDLADPAWFVLAAVAYLAILRFDRRPASRPVLALTGTVAILGGLLAPAFLPPVQEDDRPLVGGVQAGINPLINLGLDLRRGDAVVALTYQTTTDQPVYLRLGTLEQFNGRTWSPNLVPEDPERTVDEFPAPPGLAPDVNREELTADVSIADIAGRWLPLPYPTVKVEGVAGGWYWEPDGLAARSPDTAVRGQRYEATFLDVRPTLDQVSRALPFEQDASLPTLTLPARLPEVIVETAERVAGDLPTSYERAIALQDFFTSGDFTYSTNAPVAGNYDGTGMDVIARFLAEKSGYCVHYASAMAVMARVLGIPSRVAVGFQPGEPISAQGVTLYTVTSHDLHAWPELYFEGVGWLRFEPTPGRGELPDYEYVPPVDDPATPEDESAQPTPTITATPGAAPERPDVDDPAVGGQAGAEAATASTPLVLIAAGGVAALVLVAPAAVRIAIRRRRYSAIRRGRDPAVAAWAELRDTARDHGWAAPESETPRDFADRLAVVLTSEREAIAGFRGDVEESAFAPPGRGVPTVAELRALRRAIAGTVDVRDRLRAVLLPASLLIRFRWDPEG